MSNVAQMILFFLFFSNVEISLAVYAKLLIIIQGSQHMQAGDTSCAV